MELLIGCGGNHAKQLHMEGRSNWTALTTLDINPDHKPDVVHDLENLPLPFPDNSFSEIHAYEVLEHTGKQGDWRFYFAQFSEFWRILKHGGYVLGTSPHWSSRWLWGDPGHTRVMAPETFVFLSQKNYDDQIGKTHMTDYRFIYKADFDLVHCRVHEGGSTEFALQAVKPSRISI